MTAVQILSLGDAAAMAALHAAAFPASEAWPVNAFNDLVAQQTTITAGLFIGGDLHAMLVAQFVASEAEILTLATAPVARRRGFAEKLLSDLEQRLRPKGLTKWLLDVAADNVGAIAFYEKQGFQVDGRRSNYYHRLEGQQIDAILMSKPVGGQITK